MNIEESFYKSKRLQMKILLGKSQVALRKCHTNNKAFKAGNLKKDGGLESLLYYVEGYKFPKALGGSPAYFENAKRVLFAMIRQLYTASLFVVSHQQKHNGFTFLEFLVNWLIRSCIAMKN